MNLKLWKWQQLLEWCLSLPENQILHVAAKGYMATKPGQLWSAFTQMPLAKACFCGLLFLLCLSWSFMCSDICDSADTNEDRHVFSFV